MMRFHMHLASLRVKVWPRPRMTFCFLSVFGSLIISMKHPLIASRVSDGPLHKLSSPNKCFQTPIPSQTTRNYTLPVWDERPTIFFSFLVSVRVGRSYNRAGRGKHFYLMMVPLCFKLWSLLFKKLCIFFFLI